MSFLVFINIDTKQIVQDEFSKKMQQIIHPVQTNNGVSDYKR